MTDTRFFDTQVINLEKVNNRQFYVPTYQRPYVWGQVEIHKLLTDFYKTFQSGNKQPYFIGTILTKEGIANADLIDGQQRFTTLWLTAFVFRKMDIQTDLIRFLEDESKRLRLGFEIRKEVELYLNQLLGHNLEGLTISTHEVDKLPYLKNVAEGLATIENIITQFDRSSLPEFGNYIYRQVFMVKNKTPENIDLNHLFATINSAGIQLEQADIVKSNLLRIIGDEKVLYSKIWEACQNMNNFFERNARAVFNQSKWENIDLSTYTAFNESLFRYESYTTSSADDTAFTIEEIIKNNTDNIYTFGTQETKGENESTLEEVYCRSILNFGQLLLHTYRLHLKLESLSDFEGTFHVNRLIEIFRALEERGDKEEVKRFFRLLWDVRFLFDKYVIKWVSDLDRKTEHLELVNINRNTDFYYTRNKYEKSPSLMLQSVLYFTGDYLRQFWLTPYLWYLFNNKESNLEPNGDQVLLLLEDIDNQLSICESTTDKEATFKLLEEDLDSNFDIARYLKSNLGTSFKHYWFQKLEYILWKNWPFEKSNKSDNEKFKAFRITSKNSVEHIYPQNPKNSPVLSEELLHDFGNLVLLSVSQNSEYSNKEVNVKREEFEVRNSYDTLKSYYIFHCYEREYGANIIFKHRDQMIDLIISHYCKKSKLMLSLNNE